MLQVSAVRQTGQGTAICTILGADAAGRTVQLKAWRGSANLMAQHCHAGRVITIDYLRADAVQAKFNRGMVPIELIASPRTEYNDHGPIAVRATDWTTVTLQEVASTLGTQFGTL